MCLDNIQSNIIVIDISNIIKNALKHFSIKCNFKNRNIWVQKEKR